MNKKAQRRSVITFILSIVAMIAMVLLGSKTTAQEAGGSELNLDNVTVTSFKIIDVANGNKEIEYKKQSDAQYEEYKSDPTNFSNSLTENQKNSNFMIQMSVSYNSREPIKEGDTLVIPAYIENNLSSFAKKSLLDGTNHELGTWEYKNGNIVINFSGDYIKNNRITKFTASFETGKIQMFLSSGPKTTKLGERMVLPGKIGNEEFVAAKEKPYVLSSNINTTRMAISKGAPRGTDSVISWQFDITSDFYQKDFNGKTQGFFNPYLLENNGQYSPNALSDLYLEDTIENVVEIPGNLQIYVRVSGVDDDGKVISGSYVTTLPTSFLKRVDQGSKTKDEVKATLKPGEYSVYDNKNGSYTLMLKMWDMSSSNGPKYEDIPVIKSAGGVGNYLKETEPELFGTFKPETIEKINTIFKGKTIQNVFLYFNTKHLPVNERTEIPNTAKFESKQT